MSCNLPGWPPRNDAGFQPRNESAARQATAHEAAEDYLKKQKDTCVNVYVYVCMYLSIIIYIHILCHRHSDHIIMAHKHLQLFTQDYAHIFER